MINYNNITNEGARYEKKVTIVRISLRHELHYNIAFYVFVCYYYV